MKRHSSAIVVGWLIVTVIGLLLAQRISHRQPTSFSTVNEYSEYKIGPRFLPLPMKLSTTSLKPTESVTQVVASAMDAVPQTKYTSCASSPTYISIGGDESPIKLPINTQLYIQPTDNDEWFLIVNDEYEGLYVQAAVLSDNVTELATTSTDVVLTQATGKITGPSGTETYYNLNMSYCVARMQNLGYTYEYWVRDDGVKMFGPFVMCAADLSIRPLGTLVESSLGTAIVVDTGEFVNYDATRLDICTTW